MESRMLKGTLVFVVPFLLSILSPSIFAATYDCSGVSGAMRRICEVPELESLNAQHQAYMDALHRANPKASLQIASLNSAHRKWLDRCADDACIQEWFLVQIQALKQGNWGSPNLHGQLELQNKTSPQAPVQQSDNREAESGEPVSPVVAESHVRKSHEAQANVADSFMEKVPTGPAGSLQNAVSGSKPSLVSETQSENFIFVGIAWLWSWLKTIVSWAVMLLLGWLGYNFFYRSDSARSSQAGRSAETYTKRSTSASRQATNSAELSVTSRKSTPEQAKLKRTGGVVGYTVFGVNIHSEPLPYKGSMNDFNYLCENGKPMVRGTSYGSVTGYQTKGKLQVFFKPGRDPSKYRFDAAGGVEIYKMK